MRGGIILGRRNGEVRFKWLRILLDDFNSILRGWYFRFASQRKVQPDEYMDWHTVSDFSTNIKWREELGELNQNRIDNMKLCCKKINGIVLKPGQVFSLRRIIGEPTAINGFKDGPMIINGKLGFTSGGGLCQVSTTLFNSALTGGLKILQKYNHSRDIWGENRFIELGKDAVYVFARKDLKFKNSLGSDIVILMDVNDESLKLNCRVLCPVKCKYNVEVHSTVLKEINPVLPCIDTGGKRTVPYKGWIVLTKRYIKTYDDCKKVTYCKKEVYAPGTKIEG